MYNYYQQTLKFVHLSQEAVSNSTEGSIYITQAVKKSKGSPDPHVPVFERSTYQCNTVIFNLLKINIKKIKNKS